MWTAQFSSNSFRSASQTAHLCQHSANARARELGAATIPAEMLFIWVSRSPSEPLINAIPGRYGFPSPDSARIERNIRGGGLQALFGHALKRSTLNNPLGSATKNRSVSHT